MSWEKMATSAMKSKEQYRIANDSEIFRSWRNIPSLSNRISSSKKVDETIIKCSRFVVEKSTKIFWIIDFG